MKRLILLLCATTLALLGCNDRGPTTVEPADEITADKMGLSRGGSVLRLLGEGVAYAGTVPDIDGDGQDDEANCFDVDILDASGRKVGTATDCLSKVTPVGDGLQLVGTTTFRLRNGTIVTRGRTTVQPVTTEDPTPITHITGAIPMDGSNGVLSGTGAYSRYRAQVRLSGAVNLSKLDQNRITFDCLFAFSPL